MRLARTATLSRWPMPAFIDKWWSSYGSGRAGAKAAKEKLRQMTEDAHVPGTTSETGGYAAPVLARGV